MFLDAKIAKCVGRLRIALGVELEVVPEGLKIGDGPALEFLDEAELLAYLQGMEFMLDVMSTMPRDDLQITFDAWEEIGSERTV